MPDYRDYQPEKTSRVREDVEWSVSYNFKALDRTKPRVLLIGDSIVNGYQDFVRGILEPEMNTSFWASSKCVTDPDYFRELDLILDGANADVITFNNGLHSLLTDMGEWETAYRAAVNFITAKCPQAKVMIVLTTPHGVDNGTVIKLNSITEKTASDAGLPIIDLYSLMIGKVSDGMCDPCHWKEEGRRAQAEAVAEAARKILL